MTEETQEVQQVEVNLDVRQLTFNDAIDLANAMSKTVHDMGVPYPIELVMDSLLMQVAFIGKQIAQDMDKDEFVQRIMGRMEYIYDFIKDGKDIQMQ